MQATKTGELFVFDRETGTPLHPIEEVAVGMPLELTLVAVGDGQSLPQWRPRA